LVEVVTKVKTIMAAKHRQKY